MYVVKQLLWNKKVIFTVLAYTPLMVAFGLIFGVNFWLAFVASAYFINNLMPNKWLKDLSVQDACEILAFIGAGLLVFNTSIFAVLSIGATLVMPLVILNKWLQANIRNKEDYLSFVHYVFALNISKRQIINFSVNDNKQNIKYLVNVMMARIADFFSHWMALRLVNVAEKLHNEFKFNNSVKNDEISREAITLFKSFSDGSKQLKLPLALHDLLCVLENILTVNELRELYIISASRDTCVAASKSPVVSDGMRYEKDNNRVKCTL